MTPPAPAHPTAPQGATGVLVWSEARFRAMGTDVHLAVLADDPALLDDARRRIDDLEQRWSRFLAESLLCRLNRAAGQAVPVDDETFDLIATAIGAWHGTGTASTRPSSMRWCRPATTGRSTRSAPGPPPPRARSSSPAPGCASIVLDPVSRSVTLPVGTHLDLGGIGKGRAADLVAVDLLIGGAQSALVNLGGDLRIAGGLADGDAFSIAIDDPVDAETPVTVVDLVTGALATSSRARRHWTVDGEERHHLIDPTTGAPAHTDVAAVTVITHEATDAEIVAKAAPRRRRRRRPRPPARCPGGRVAHHRGPHPAHRVGDFKDHER